MGGTGLAAIHLGRKDNPHHYIGNLYAKGNEIQTVATISLGALFEQNGIDRCAVLKLDAEGAEWDILPATSEDTLGRIRHMRGEYHTVSGPAPRTRAALLALTKGLFDDITGTPDVEGSGPFSFVRRAA